MVPKVVRGDASGQARTLDCWLKYASTKVLLPVEVPAGRGEQGPVLSAPKDSPSVAPKESGIQSCYLPVLRPTI